MICLMHAGSGLCNELNLTSSRELIWTGCCYLLCVYCLDICHEETSRKSWLLPMHTNNLFLRCLSCRFMLSHKRGCHICWGENILGFALTFIRFLGGGEYIIAFIQLVTTVENSLCCLFELTEWGHICTTQGNSSSLPLQTARSGF